MRWPKLHMHNKLCHWLFRLSSQSLPSCMPSPSLSTFVRSLSCLCICQALARLQLSTDRRSTGSWDGWYHVCICKPCLSVASTLTKPYTAIELYSWQCFADLFVMLVCEPSIILYQTIRWAIFLGGGDNELLLNIDGNLVACLWGTMLWYINYAFVCEVWWNIAYELHTGTPSWVITIRLLTLDVRALRPRWTASDPVTTQSISAVNNFTVHPSCALRLSDIKWSETWLSDIPLQWRRFCWRNVSLCGQVNERLTFSRWSGWGHVSVSIEASDS